MREKGSGDQNRSQSEITKQLATGYFTHFLMSSFQETFKVGITVCIFEVRKGMPGEVKCLLRGHLARKGNAGI